MLLLILESLGSTELFFILIMALVFFGPRKLPQISRSLGKSLAEFRRASDDFKRTWEREVAMESTQPEQFSNMSSNVDESYSDDGPPLDSLPEPQTENSNIHPVATPDEYAIPRGQSTASSAVENEPEVASSEPSPKRDWL